MKGDRMALYTVWGKAPAAASFERFCEIDQVVTQGTDALRDQVASIIATYWMQANGGQIEFRNSSGGVVLRLTQP